MIALLLFAIILPQAFLINQDTEKQYSPHFWSKKYAPETALQTFLNTIAESCNRTRETVPYEADIRYGPGERETLDIYGGDTISKDAPIVLYLHGGYWQVEELTKNITCQPVHPLWKRGIRVFVAGYDLAPKVSIGDIIRETRELGAFVMNYAIKNYVKQVWIVGHSVGSHLAASLLYKDWMPPGASHILSGMLLITGVYDLTPLPQTSFNEALRLDDSLARKWSPMFEKEVSLPVSPKFKVVVVTGENESPEFIQQSRSFYNVLTKQGITSEFHILSNLDHFDIASNLQYEDFLLTRNITNFFSVNL